MSPSSRVVVGYVCITCGDIDHEVAGRCPRCGARVFAQESEERMESIIARAEARGQGTEVRDQGGLATNTPVPRPVTPDPSPRPLKLKPTRALQRWLSATAELKEDFLTQATAEAARAQEIHAEAKAVQAQAHELKRAASLFDQVLGLLAPDGVEAVAALPTGEATTGRMNRLGRWAMKYDCCQRCGTTEKAHNSLGLCTTCYARRRDGRDA